MDVLNVVLRLEDLYIIQDGLTKAISFYYARSDFKSVDRCQSTLRIIVDEISRIK